MSTNALEKFGRDFLQKIVARVPAGPDDALLDWLLTEQRAARLGEGNTA